VARHRLNDHRSEVAGHDVLRGLDGDRHQHQLSARSDTLRSPARKNVVLELEDTRRGDLGERRVAEKNGTIRLLVYEVAFRT